MRFLSKISWMVCMLLAGTLAAGEIRTVTEDQVEVTGNLVEMGGVRAIVVENSKKLSD